MTVSMRVMSAGDGYKYLLRTIAAVDEVLLGEGTPPGNWMGSALPGLGDGQIGAADQVSEAQLQLLIGMGRDPITGKPLGRAFPRYVSVADRISERVKGLDAGLGMGERAEEVVRIEAEETERGNRRAVAGFDYTFSVPKSVSVLWGVADAGTQALIAQAHHEAVTEVLEFMEREVAATRTGYTAADGAVAQVDVTGLVATAFDHYDSRSSDPQLHKHVVVSNKVQTALDGRWRSLDGRPMHATVVALSEHYNAVLADRLTGMLGLGWEARDRGWDRNPALEPPRRSLPAVDGVAVRVRAGSGGDRRDDRRCRRAGLSAVDAAGAGLEPGRVPPPGRHQRVPAATFDGVLLDHAAGS